MSRSTSKLGPSSPAAANLPLALEHGPQPAYRVSGGHHPLALALARLALAFTVFILTALGCGPSDRPALPSEAGAGGVAATGGAPETGGAATGGRRQSDTGGSAGSARATGGITHDGSAGAGAGAPGEVGGGAGKTASGGASGGASSHPGGNPGGGAGATGGASTGGAAPGGGSGIPWGTPAMSGGPPLTGAPVKISVTVSPGMITGRLAAGYGGFSVEKTHITDPYFAADDKPLVALFRLLGPGFLRIGGADVERCTWEANAALGTAAHPVYKIGTAAVDQLAGFLEATGWKAIYGLPLASVTTTATAAEAAYVAGKLGSHLASFELGNEPASWTTTKPKWAAAAQAIAAMSPTVKLAGPATTGSTSFDASFANDEAGKFAVLTHHYYRGIGTSPSATIDNMLSTDPNLLPTMNALAAIVKAHPEISDGFRLGETNSYWHHGSPNVSNSYAAAVWGVDYMLNTAQAGCQGVHFHGGGENMDGNVCNNGPASCSSPFVYSPLAEEASRVAVVQGVYYAMLVIAQAGAGALLRTTTDAGNVNVRAYALSLADGSTEIVLINKTATTAVEATVDVGAAVSAASAAYLLGPSLSATVGMTFAGSAVSVSGQWSPSAPYIVPVNAGKIVVAVPAGSVALVRAH